MSKKTPIAYAASKGALKAMTLCLARSLGLAIRVNAVLPGFDAARITGQLVTIDAGKAIGRLG